MDAIVEKNNVSIFDVDESELLAKLERAEKKENIAPKHLNTISTSSTYNTINFLDLTVRIFFVFTPNARY